MEKKRKIYFKPMNIFIVIGAIIALLLDGLFFPNHPCIPLWQQLIINCFLVIIPYILTVRDDTINYNKGIDNKEEEAIINRFLKDSKECGEKKIDINRKGTIIKITRLNYVLLRDYTEKEREIIIRKGLINREKIINIPIESDNYLSTQGVIINSDRPKDDDKIEPNEA
jgi:hypothetical protein